MSGGFGPRRKPQQAELTVTDSILLISKAKDNALSSWFTLKNLLEYQIAQCEIWSLGLNYNTRRIQKDLS